MDEIRKRNAKELRRAWNKFLKEQKHGRDTKGKRDSKAGTEKME
jgi:hypothetical protein